MTLCPLSFTFKQLPMSTLRQREAKLWFKYTFIPYLLILSFKKIYQMLRKESSPWGPKMGNWHNLRIQLYTYECEVEGYCSYLFSEEEKKVVAVFHHWNVDRTSLMVIDKKYLSQLGYVHWDLRRKVKNFHFFNPFFLWKEDMCKYKERNYIFYTYGKYLYYCHMKRFLKWDIKIYNPKFYKWEVILK